MTTRTNLPAGIEQPHSSATLRAAGACFFKVDLNGIVTAMGREIEQITGLDRSLYIGRPFSKLVCPAAPDDFAEVCRQARQGALVTSEIKLKTVTQACLWVRCALVADKQNQTCVGFHGMLVNIHQLKEAHADMAAQKERYRGIIDDIWEGYFETDLNGHFTFCNQALVRIAGYTREELIGKSYTQVTSPRTSRAMQAIFGRIFKNGGTARAENYEVFHKDGYTLTIEFSASAILDAHQKPIGFRGIVRDVSEQVRAYQAQKRYQAQQNHTQKMEALGTLAGGLAHGFNNVLMAIQGNLSLMRMTLAKGHPLQKNIERISKSTDKGVTLAKQILSFAKMGRFVVMTTNLNKILRSTSRMFLRSKENLRIHEFYDPNVWHVEVDRVQIGQLLLSLYMNAADAMPDGGDVYLQSENVVLDESQTKPHDAKPGRFVKISVTDSGMGLSQEARQRVFEPFFSAYRPTRYEGLGLAAVYGTVKSHQGIINVYSEKNHGTTFSIYLPASQKNWPNERETLIPPKGTETLLLVDDDENAARVGRDILERAGYRVLVAGSGQEAIDTYKDHFSKIALVLLDVVMPGLGGSQVYQRLKKINPDASVVAISGFSVNREIIGLLDQGCLDFIQKPFQVQALTTKIRTILDANPTGPVDAGKEPPS